MIFVNITSYSDETTNASQRGLASPMTRTIYIAPTDGRCLRDGGRNDHGWTATLRAHNN